MSRSVVVSWFRARFLSFHYFHPNFKTNRTSPQYERSGSSLLKVVKLLAMNSVESSAKLVWTSDVIQSSTEPLTNTFSLAHFRHLRCTVSAFRRSS